MNRTLLTLLVIILLAVGAGYYAFQNGLIGDPATGEVQTQEDENAEEEIDSLENVIWASGKLEPVVWAGLNASATGIVSQIHVREGEWVESGTVLVELDTTSAEADLLVAEASVVEARAALNKLLAGATEADIAAAEAAVAAA